ncbi:hypothetical protein ACOMHN_045221 [Nucella lapillus]
MPLLQIAVEDSPELSRTSEMSVDHDQVVSRTTRQPSSCAAPGKHGVPESTAHGRGSGSPRPPAFLQLQ